jgi:hypothetical protein
VVADPHFFGDLFFCISLCEEFEDFGLAYGERVGGGIGGFELMPDPNDLSVFGGGESAAGGTILRGLFFAGL